MSRPRKYPLYCDPIELHNEIMIMKETGVTSEKLGVMYQNIVNGIFSRPNFSGYNNDFSESMKFCAIKYLILYTSGYNPSYFTLNTNAAFTYCSRIVFQCFTMTITLMKKKTAKNKEMMTKIYSDQMLSSGRKINNKNQ
jgi:hypothetical protein